MGTSPGEEEGVTRVECDCDFCYQENTVVEEDSQRERVPFQGEQLSKPVAGFRPWAQQEKASLREMFADGETLETMSDLLGRSQNAVLLKLIKIGLLSEVDLSNAVHDKQQQFIKRKITKASDLANSSRSRFIQAVVVANSYKHLGRCLAVIDLQTSELLRPVFDDIHRELPESYTQIFEGGGVRSLTPGDFVTIPLTSEDETFWQRENWFVDPRLQIKSITNNLEHLNLRAREAAKSHYNSPDLLLATQSGSISASEVGRGNASLELRLVANVKIFDRTRANGKKGLRAEFDYKGQTYSFAFTDEKAGLGHGSKIERAMVCLSLGEEINGKHYKLVAGLMPVTSL